MTTVWWTKTTVSPHDDRRTDATNEKILAKFVNYKLFSTVAIKCPSSRWDGYHPVLCPQTPYNLFVSTWRMIRIVDHTSATRTVWLWISDFESPKVISHINRLPFSIEWIWVYHLMSIISEYIYMINITLSFDVKYSGFYGTNCRYFMFFCHWLCLRFSRSHFVSWKNCNNWLVLSQFVFRWFITFSCLDFIWHLADIYLGVDLDYDIQHLLIC